MKAKFKIQETTGQKIKRIRETKGLLQMECAQKIGMQFQNWNRYESDRGNPTMDTLKKIANVLNVKVREIISDFS